MLIDEYVEEANKTNLMGNNLLYHYLGLISEVRELAPYLSSDHPDIQEILRGIETVGSQADKVAKDMRNNDAQYSYKLHTDEPLTLLNLKKELGDIAWFYTMFIRACGFFVADVLRANLWKLADRARRNAIKGTGDNR